MAALPYPEPVAGAEATAFGGRDAEPTVELGVSRWGFADVAAPALWTDGSKTAELQHPEDEAQWADAGWADGHVSMTAERDGGAERERKLRLHRRPGKPDLVSANAVAAAEQQPSGDAQWAAAGWADEQAGATAGWGGGAERERELCLHRRPEWPDPTPYAKCM